MRKWVVIILLLLYLPCKSQVLASVAPPRYQTYTRLPARVVNGDTMGIVTMGPAMVYGCKVFANCAQAADYYYLVQNIKTVYPYAVMAGITFQQCEETISTMSGRHEQKKYIKQVEKQLKAQYEDELKSLTIDQGRLLIKLIDRQTGNSSYELVRQLRGSFSAFMWQTFASLFGNDMKDTYDPQGKDKNIEDIIQLIQEGAI